MKTENDGKHRKQDTRHIGHGEKLTNKQVEFQKGRRKSPS